MGAAWEAPTPIPSPPPESAGIGPRPSGPPSAGEVSAFAALYEQHALEIHDFLLRTVRDGAAAEDLTQMTFLRAFERRNTLSDPGKVPAPANRSSMCARVHPEQSPCRMLYLGTK